MTIVQFRTSAGSFKIELDNEATPITTQNFLDYVKAGYYNGTIFHRVIKGFMIQGGGFAANMQQKASPKNIKNEAKTGLKNEIGTIAMARTSEPHSASSQFFINVANNAFLDFKSETPDGFGYCAFGKVTDGLDVVIDISRAITTNKHGHGDVPVEDILVIEAEVLE